MTNEEPKKDIKPLGQKAYGSIPHLPNSRMGAADHACHEGQFKICCEKPRDKHDRIIVTEKLDGSCNAVANIDGKIVAVGRAGYLASSSPFDHVQAFAKWVELNPTRFDALPLGHRIIGEWMALAHGTTYKRFETPFFGFDVMAGHVRLSHDEARHIISACGLPSPFVVSDGSCISVTAAMAILGLHGQHGALEPIEGAVWRVERRGKFDFLTKWVNPAKIDGKYLPDITGMAPLWMTDISYFERAA